MVEVPDSPGELYDVALSNALGGLDRVVAHIKQERANVCKGHSDSEIFAALVADICDQMNGKLLCWEEVISLYSAALVRMSKEVS